MNHTASIALFPSDGGMWLVNIATIVCGSLFWLGFLQCSVVIEHNGVEKLSLHDVWVVEPQHLVYIQVLQGQQDFFLPTK
jgi:hypothetical protein